MPNDISIGARLRHFRERKKLTKAAVAQKTGIDLDELHQIESENTDPTIGQIKRIAESIEISLLDLFALPPTSFACNIRLLAQSADEVSPASFDAIPVPLVSGEVAGGNARIVEENIVDWLFCRRRNSAANRAISSPFAYMEIAWRRKFQTAQLSRWIETPAKSGLKVFMPCVIRTVGVL